MLCSPASAESFLKERKSSLRTKQDSSDFQKELRTATGEALGCGGHVGSQQMKKIRESMQPMWNAMQKDGNGRIDKRSLRYLVYRHFHQKWSLMIKGFEPSRPTNLTGWGSSDDILSATVPGFVEGVLESRHAQDHGFDLQDAVYMVATIEELIFDSESVLLERVYESQRKPMTRSVSQTGMQQILESYLVHWMLADDEEGIKLVLQKKAFMKDIIPHWDQILAYLNGRAQEVIHLREQRPRESSEQGHNAFAPYFSFDDAHAIVGGITKSFASFWESECSVMKAALVKMDVHNTGRVPLSKFYSTALDTEWRFGESEAYLRDLGALDETSSWYGKQVIIPNYMQAVSNCVVGSKHYLVCCQNDCEDIFGEIESKLPRPTAQADQILSVVGNITAQLSVDDDDPPHLDASLHSQLNQIAAGNGGQVPLHGRLFAQWLHYVFPRQCPFPHKSGTASALTPAEFGDGFIASKNEMKTHAASVNETELVAAMGKEDLQWMSQWSPEEELITDLPQGAAGSKNAMIVAAVILLALIGVAGAMKSGKGSSEKDMLPCYSKSVFV